MIYENIEFRKKYQKEISERNIRKKYQKEISERRNGYE